jgi:hypothetical protein
LLLRPERVGLITGFALQMRLAAPVPMSVRRTGVTRIPTANRRALAVGRDALRHDYPLDTREVLTALVAGRQPPANGIVIL